ncbi:protein FAR1-RELATED SEQUENCE 5-like [Lotus japonicus]|uniref:protein FAR1-RELATED SEQUENCE 5-like n=1 Tax=Lotus japonicus TaxID=34305 RepID=UPI00258BC960|nr:protein FAR1-RELATED SEQUENCE 5-like [Lotus japonicus]
MTEPYLYEEDLLVDAACDAACGSGNVEPPSNIIPWVPPRISVDATHLFTTDQIFDTRDELEQWAKNVGKTNGYVLVIARSDYAISGGKVFVTIKCAKHGIYRPYKDPNTFKYKKTASQKTDCKFNLKGRPTKGDRMWWLKVMDGKHNHEPAKSLVGHPYVGRLTEEEKGLVGTMTSTWTPPRQILAALKENNPSNLTTITQVYSCNKRFKKEERGPLTEMQHLMKKLVEAKYVHFERQQADSSEIRDLFWAHPDAVRLFNTFPHVVIMDCTYKTNRYQIPLLEMVGLTSTGLTFSIAFCYIVREFADDARLPQVIVTDRDLALLSAVKQCLPNCTNLLCRFHINKNVEAKCKVLIGTDDFALSVMENWKCLIYAETVEQFDEEWKEMCVMCKDFPDFISYISTTWLKHKEKFVSAWTNSVLHFGTTTSNRAESAHSTLKRMLKDGRGDLCAAWDAVDRLTTVRHNEIKASFERSINLVEHRFKSPMYTNIRGFVSRKAMQLMEDEQNRVMRDGCGCAFQVTHGLPCACALHSYDRIPYEAIHTFWKILGWDHVPIGSQASNQGDLKSEIDGLTAYFNTLDVAGQSMLRRKVKELYCPSSSSLCPPQVKIKPKRSSKAMESKPPSQQKPSLQRDPCYWEHVNNSLKPTPNKVSCPRSKKSKKSKQSSTSIYLDDLPSFFHQYIEKVIDVIADGNCGYRSVAALFRPDIGQDGWPLIREELLVELSENTAYYSNIFGYERVQSLQNRLILPIGTIATEDKWMSLPEMGYLIATRLQVVFISISLKGCYTYLPLRGGAPPEVHPVSRHQPLCSGITFMKYLTLACHLKLKPGHPMPTIAPQWPFLAKEPTDQWIFPYAARLATFTAELNAWIDPTGGPQENVFIDLGED